MNSNNPLLEVNNLSTTFRTEGGELVAVDDINFTVNEAETVCIVGESGSGKTVATESVTRLIKEPPGNIKGEILFDGKDLMNAGKKEIRSIRGNSIAHIFQNPQEAMNHCYTVGWQIVEALRVHQEISKKEAKARAIDLMDRVGIANASTRFDDYPHEFSGGQKQRVMIAMALVGNPDLLIADEPTTALDVTVQAQILNLLRELQDDFGMSILLVTHDLGVVAEIADRVVVMYAGKVMERGDVFEIFEKTGHPYTQALIECIPDKTQDLTGIPGTLPNPIHPPNGCRFAERCEHALEECEIGDQPEEIALSESHKVSCIFHQSMYDSSTIMESQTTDDHSSTMEATND